MKYEMDEEEPETKATTSIDKKKVAQLEKIGLSDLLIAGSLGIVTFVLLTLWQFPCMTPNCWEASVIASGVKPAAKLLGNYWPLIASFFYSALGIDGANSLQMLLGRVAIGGLTFLAYMLSRELLSFIMMSRPQFASARRTNVMRAASALAALSFAMADPVWSIGQFASQTLVLLTLTMAALEFFFVFLRKGQLRYAFLMAAALGLITADSAFGALLAVFFMSVYLFVVRRNPEMESPFFKPAILEVGKWHVTAIFILGILAGIGLDIWGYVKLGGLEANAQSAGEIPLIWANDYLHGIVNAASPAAWIIWIGVMLVPCMVTFFRFPVAADEDVFLDYSTGVLFAFCGLVALSQAAGLPALWFWTYIPVDSGFLHTVGIVMNAVTLALALTVLGIDTYCRDHQKLARTLYGMGEDEDDDSDEAYSKSGLMFVRYAILAVLPVLFLAALLPGRKKTNAREMMSMLDDAVHSLIKECEDATYIFSDGHLDDYIELVSASQGHHLNCISFFSGGSPRDVMLRTRGMDPEGTDAFAIGHDGGMGLRSWIRDKPEVLTNAAVMMGFDLWKRDGKPVPPIGGLLSRPAGWNDEEVKKQGIAFSKELIDRVNKLYENGGTSDCSDTVLKDKFLALQWRLARMNIYRAENYDLMGEPLLAMQEVESATALNDKNETYQKLIATVTRRVEQMQQKITPREGLQLALARADFRMARIYAQPILEEDENDPDGNFAMGMYELGERQLARAEEYLKRVLVRKPNEAAVYNNLAAIQTTLGRYKEAKVNVDKALELVPGSAAVIDTRKQLEAAIKEAVAKKVEETNKKAEEKGASGK